MVYQEGGQTALLNPKTLQGEMDGNEWAQDVEQEKEKDAEASFFE